MLHHGSVQDGSNMGTPPKVSRANVLTRTPGLINSQPQRGCVLKPNVVPMKSGLRWVSDHKMSTTLKGLRDGINPKHSAHRIRSRVCEAAHAAHLETQFAYGALPGSLYQVDINSRKRMRHANRLSFRNPFRVGSSRYR